MEQNPIQSKLPVINDSMVSERLYQHPEIQRAKSWKKKTVSVLQDVAAFLLLLVLSFGFALMAYDQSEKAQIKAQKYEVVK